MSVAELKEEAIRQFVQKVEATGDEKVLEMIVAFLKGIDVSDTNPVNLARHYDSIKARYGSVLQKLAE